MKRLLAVFFALLVLTAYHNPSVTDWLESLYGNIPKSGTYFLTTVDGEPGYVDSIEFTQGVPITRQNSETNGSYTHTINSGHTLIFDGAGGYAVSMEIPGWKNEFVMNPIAFGLSQIQPSGNSGFVLAGGDVTLQGRPRFISIAGQNDSLSVMAIDASGYSRSIELPISRAYSLDYGDSTLTTTNTSRIDYLDESWNDAPDGTYKVTIGFNWSTASNTTAIRIRISMNAVGLGPAGNNNVFQSRPRNTSDRLYETITKVMEVTGGAGIRLRVQTESVDGNAVTIDNLSATLERMHL